MKYYTKELQLLAEISAYISVDKIKRSESAIKAYRKSNYNPLKLYETILQSYLFCGFPAAIETLRIFKSVFTDFTFPPADKKYGHKSLMVEGEFNCNLIYKNNYKKLIENMNNFSPDLKEWMILEGYGKVMGRKGLKLPEREIINISILCARYYKNQLHSHLKGCLNLGVTTQEMNIILDSFYGFIKRSNVDKCKALYKMIIKYE